MIVETDQGKKSNKSECNIINTWGVKMAGISNARLDAVLSERVEKTVEGVISKIQDYATSVATMRAKKPEDAREPYDKIAQLMNGFSIRSAELQNELAWATPKEEAPKEMLRGFDSN